MDHFKEVDMSCNLVIKKLIPIDITPLALIVCFLAGRDIKLNVLYFNCFLLQPHKTIVISLTNGLELSVATRINPLGRGSCEILLVPAFNG